jgi:hypothetical protein
MSQPLVFISYSHKDEAEKDRLMSHLKAVTSDSISVWSDAHLRGGGEWEWEINQAIGQAKVAILLVTADFLNSEYVIEKEVPKLLERREKEGLVVVPVIARACAWKKVSWLSNLNVMPRTGRPVWRAGSKHVDEALAGIAEEVAQVIEKASDLSNPESTKILVVHHSSYYRRAIATNLEDTSITFFEADSVEEGIRILEYDQDVRVILLDLELMSAGGGSINLLEYTKDRSSDYRVIVLGDPEALMPADVVSSYTIFSCIPNSVGGLSALRFEVERAIEDINREKLAREKRTAEDLGVGVPTFFRDGGEPSLIKRAEWLREKLGLDDAFFARLLGVEDEQFYRWRISGGALREEKLSEFREFWEVILHLLSFFNLDISQVRNFIEHEEEERPVKLPFDPPWVGTSVRAYLAITGRGGAQKLNRWIQSFQFADRYSGEYEGLRWL